MEREQPFTLKYAVHSLKCYSVLQNNPPYSAFQRVTVKPAIVGFVTDSGCVAWATDTPASACSIQAQAACPPLREVHDARWNRAQSLLCLEGLAVCGNPNTTVDPADEVQL